MTELELIARAAEQLGADQPQNMWFAKEGTIKLAVAYALHDTAREVARNPQLRHHLQNLYEVTVTSGSADLTNSTAVPDVATYAPILTEFACYNLLLDADGNRYTYLEQYRDLLLDQPAVMGYYALAGQTLKTRELSSGDLAASASFTYLASYIPTVAQLRGEIEDIAVEKLVSVLRSPVPEDA